MIPLAAQWSTWRNDRRGACAGERAESGGCDAWPAFDAATWFNWWPGRGNNPIVWFGVAYAAYIAGLELARFETRIGGRVVGLDSRERWAAMVPFRKGSALAAKQDDGAQPEKGDEGN